MEKNHRLGSEGPRKSAAGGRPVKSGDLTVPLDRFYGNGVQYPSLREMKMDLQQLYRYYSFKKLCRIKNKLDKHSSWVIIGRKLPSGKIIYLLADWINMRILPIKNIEIDRPVLAGTLKNPEPAAKYDVIKVLIETPFDIIQIDKKHDVNNEWKIKATPLLKLMEVDE